MPVEAVNKQHSISARLSRPKDTRTKVSLVRIWIKEDGLSMVGKVHSLPGSEGAATKRPLFWYVKGPKNLMAGGRGDKELPVISKGNESPIEKEVDVWGQE
jgi:hypothetical protein